MAKADIVLVANSPGELSALVMPTVEKIQEKLPQARIILVLTPCQYTSGKELDYVKSIAGITLVVTAREYQQWALFNRKPAIEFSEKGAVLFLGGDLAHAMVVAKKLKYPAYAYIQERIGWTKFYRKFFVPDSETFWKFARSQYFKEKIQAVGNLMVDAVAKLHRWSPEEKVLTFLPGSRHWEINFMTPLYEKIAQAVKGEIPDIKLQIASSPFVPAQPFAGAKMVGLDDIWNSQLVITIPGTNTAKVAALGIPMLVIFPLNQPELIPLEGLPHYIGRIPLIGDAFKRALAKAVNKRTRFFALPNIRADREIAPEIRGEVDAGEVALKALDLLKDRNRRTKMSKDLIEAMGAGGAAEKIAEEICAAL